MANRREIYCARIGDLPSIGGLHAKAHVVVTRRMNLNGGNDSFICAYTVHLIVV